MQQNYSHEASSCSTSLDTFRLSPNSSADYRLHKTPLLDCILDQMNDVHIVIICFFRSILKLLYNYGNAAQLI